MKLLLMALVFAAAAAARTPEESAPSVEHRRKTLGDLKSLSARFSEDAGLWLDRAEIELEMGDRASVLQSLVHAEGLRLEFEEQQRAAEIYMRLKEYSRALTFFESMHKFSPQDSSYWIDKAGGAGDREEALKYLVLAEDSRPRKEERRRIAGCYRHWKDYSRAEAILKSLGRHLPEEAGLFIDRAELAIDRGDRRSAAAYLAQAAALEPSQEQRRLTARAYQKLGDYARALNILESMSGAFSGDASFYIEKADSALHLGKRNLALRLLAEAENLKPNKDELRLAAGIYWRAGQAARASGILDFLSRDLPDDFGVLIKEAHAAVQLGARDAALNVLARAEKIRPDADGRHTIALVYQDLKEYRPALDIFERLIVEYPARAKFFSDLGLCQYLSGRAQDAVKNIQTAIELDRTLFSAYINLGEIYASGGNLKQALGTYDKALAVRGKKEDDPLRAEILRSRNMLVSRMGADKD